MHHPHDRLVTPAKVISVTAAVPLPLAALRTASDEAKRAEEERKRAEEERKRADQAQARAEKLAAKLRELGLDPNGG